MTDSVTRSEFETLKAEVARLKAQLAALKPDLDETTLAAIAAAVAAYVGSNAKVRFVRRVNEAEEPWRSHGRASVVAQHKLPSLRGW